MTGNSGDKGEERMSAGKALAFWLLASIAGWGVVMLVMYLIDLG